MSSFFPRCFPPYKRQIDLTRKHDTFSLKRKLRLIADLKYRVPSLIVNRFILRNPAKRDIHFLNADYTAFRQDAGEYNSIFSKPLGIFGITRACPAASASPRIGRTCRQVPDSLPMIACIHCLDFPEHRKHFSVTQEQRAKISFLLGSLRSPTLFYDDALYRPRRLFYKHRAQRLCPFPTRELLRHKNALTAVLQVSFPQTPIEFLSRLSGTPVAAQ